MKRKVRPRLVNNSLLKPKPVPVVPVAPVPVPVVPVPVPVVPVPDVVVPVSPEGHTKVTSKASMFINLAFVIILTLIILWLYNLYIDRKNTKLTEAKDIIPSTYVHPILLEPTNNIIPSNIEDEFNYL